MDPVSIFNALYDTKCLKFGQFELKSGLVAPYYVNLRRLSLYPKLMDSIVRLTVERFLTRKALEASTNYYQNNKGTKRIKENSGYKLADSSPSDSDDVDSQIEEETDPEESDSCIVTTSGLNLSNQLDPIICGVPYGAIPLASAIAYRAGLPLLFERSEEEHKHYGDKDCLLDDFTEETRAASQEFVPTTLDNRTRQSVILIEDVICSGKSVLDTIKALEKKNLRVEFVICIVDREGDGIKLLSKEAGIKVMPLFNISAILRILEVTGRISTEQFIQTRQWMSQNQISVTSENNNNNNTNNDNDNKSQPKVICSEQCIVPKRSDILSNIPIKVTAN